MTSAKVKAKALSHRKEDPLRIAVAKSVGVIPLQENPAILRYKQQTQGNYFLCRFPKSDFSKYRLNPWAQDFST